MTEPEYFRGLEQAARSPTKVFNVEKGVGTPETILKRARKIKPSKTDNDEIWLVFDRDEHPNVDKVLREAKGNFNIAFSDPSFELWLLLHFEDYNKSCDRHQVKAVLEKHVPGYGKVDAKTVPFETLSPCIESALRRAKKMLERREEDGGTNPKTSVHELVSKYLKSNA